MYQITTNSGRHPELTTPDRRVGPVSLAPTLLPTWLDSLLPCWTESRHAFGPLFTDPDTSATGRDCYRCGRWFSGPVPDGRKLLQMIAPEESVMVSQQVAQGFLGSHARRHLR